MISAMLSDVYHRERGSHALLGISIDFFEGEAVALMGRPEAQAVLRLLAGMERPERGVVNVLGHDPYRERGALSPSIGYAHRRQYLPGVLRVGEFLALCGRMRGVAVDPGGVAEELGISGLLDLRISRIEAHRAWLVALAGALLHRPRILLLEDPLAGLGPVDMVRVRDALMRMIEEGCTAIIASSDPSLAPLLGRVVLMMEGRVAAVGRVGDLARLLGEEDHVVVRTTHAKRALELASRVPYVKKLGIGSDGSLKIWLNDLESELWPTLDLLYSMGVGIEGLSIIRIDPSRALGEVMRRIGERKG